MSHRCRRFTIVPQASALLVIVTFGYLLSYAPAYRYSPAADAPAAGVFKSVFRPAEHVIDASPLRRPLLVWSDWWGVRGLIERDSSWRELRILLREDLGEYPPIISEDPSPEVLARDHRALPAS